MASSSVVPLPPIKKTFADIIKNSAGPVSSTPLADGVVDEKFSNVGLHKGNPAIYFTDEAIDEISNPFKWTLIGKFNQGFNKEHPELGRPTVENIQKALVALDLKDTCAVGLLDSRHVARHLKSEVDYLRLYSRPVWYIKGISMRVFRWSPEFHVEKEPSFAPVWISLPKLPLHLFNKKVLFVIGALIGSPLCLDEATAKLSKPSIAKLQVEIDVLKPLPSKIWIGMGSREGFWQKFEADFIPPYCKHCWHLGHKIEDCYIRNLELKKSEDAVEQLNNGKVNGIAPFSKTIRVYRPKPDQPKLDPKSLQTFDNLNSKEEDSTKLDTNEGDTFHASVASLQVEIIQPPPEDVEPQPLVETEPPPNSKIPDSTLAHCTHHYETPAQIPTSNPFGLLNNESTKEYGCTTNSLSSVDLQVIRKKAANALPSSLTMQSINLDDQGNSEADVSLQQEVIEQTSLSIIQEGNLSPRAPNKIKSLNSILEKEDGATTSDKCPVRRSVRRQGLDKLPNFNP